MRVRVSGILEVRRILGANGREVVLPEGSTVADLFEDLRSRCGVEFARAVLESESEPHLRSWVRVQVNGQDIRWLGGTATQLRESDQVSILLPFAGG